MTNKQAYIDKTEAKMKEWAAEIDRLEAQADQAGADARIEYDKQINDLKAQQAQAEAKLDELKQSSEGAWEDLKAGMDETWSAVESTAKNIRDRFAA